MTVRYFYSYIGVRLENEIFIETVLKKMDKACKIRNWQAAPEDVHDWINENIDGTYSVPPKIPVKFKVVEFPHDLGEDGFVVGIPCEKITLEDVFETSDFRARPFLEILCDPKDAAKKLEAEFARFEIDIPRAHFKKISFRDDCNCCS